jgi:DmsE family decaheme c-type cytochrome
MTNLARTLAILGVLTLLTPTAAWVAAEEKTADLPCADCHDTVAAAFAANPHAKALGRGTPLGAVCASCHSGGQAHIDASGDKTKITVPRGAGAAGACLTCHGGKIQSDIAPKGFHALANVNCDSCHSVHNADMTAPSLLQKGGSALCVTCHPDVKASFRKPYGHRMNESAGGTGKAGMDCVSCHNPHGRTVAGSLVRSASGEVACLTCHTDKRGPFVYTHVAGQVGSCISCHAPHGSANPKRLNRTEVAQLCLECHTGLQGTGTLGSQPPSRHDLRTPRYRNCTTCHVAVHGSNASATLLR